MKKITVSLLILFLTFGCAFAKLKVSVGSLDFKVSDEIKVSAKVIINKDSSKLDESLYEFGFIYSLDGKEINEKDFQVNDNVKKVVVELDEFLNFSYVFEDLTNFDYILPLAVRAFVKDEDGKYTYTKNIKTARVFDLALQSKTDLATQIVSDISFEIKTDENFLLNFNIDEAIKGFIVNASFDKLNNDNIYGLLYKYNAPIDERSNLDFNINDYEIYYSDVLSDGLLKFELSNILKKDYSSDVTFRSFVYNKKTSLFTFSENVFTTSLYNLALNDDSSFSKEVEKEVHKGYIMIRELFINTDVDEEYQVGSHSLGVKVEMFYDYEIVKLTVTALKGYRFSSSISYKDIKILRVDDNVIVDNFTLEVSAFEIVIIYDDYGWGPPM